MEIRAEAMRKAKEDYDIESRSRTSYCLFERYIRCYVVNWVILSRFLENLIAENLSVT